MNDLTISSSGRRRPRGRRWLYFVVTLLLIQISHVRCQIESDADNEVFDDHEDFAEDKSVLAHELAFTQEAYDVVIPENSLGKVYAVPTDLSTKMGIPLPTETDPSLIVRFRIKSGDDDGFFKAEAETVGNFVFLLIRTRTNNMDVLNRERRDVYELDIRTRVRNGSSGRRLKTASEASTIVRVRVKDVNDLDPFFQPSKYAFVVPEDTPLHQVSFVYFFF